ncbi:MAG TPA: hypothetical protein VE690_11245 [Rhodopila sp.]|jgi:hypothetical protein|nr:hypothetical protein [Rhodopila sp.]
MNRFFIFPVQNGAAARSDGTVPDQAALAALEIMLMEQVAALGTALEQHMAADP